MKSRMHYKIREKDIKKFGIFVSYTHKDKRHFDDFNFEMRKANINVLSDELIPAGVEDFHKVIKSMLIESTCAVVLYNDSLTPWMLFEIGILKGMNKKIYIYSLNNGSIPSYLTDCEIVNNMLELQEKCKKNFLFSDLFENDSHIYNRGNYNNAIKDKTRYVSLKIRVPGIDEIDPQAYQFRCIISGMFKIGKEIGKKCNLCYKMGEYLEDCECSCYEKYKECPCNNASIPVNTSEVVVLNKIYDSFKVEYDEIEYVIPMNDQYGVTFKCFVDIKDFSLKDKIIDLLVDAGVIDANESGSAAQDRIYFLIPKEHTQGLFEIIFEEGIYNNYFCPGVLE